jgi:1,4-dihydroxy-2-naphthoate octaprenyltransferase
MIKSERVYLPWNRFKVLWRLFRPHTLTASFVPVLTGTTLAWKSIGHLHWMLFVAMLVASILIQAATNMFNEYFDYVSGLDTTDSVGIAGAITQDKVQPRTILHVAFTALAVATLLGIYICAHASWWLALIGALCMLAGYLYSGTSFPISATPFGELIAGGLMGTGIILLSCFIQQKSIHFYEVLLSIPSAVLIGAILTANNIRDLDGDRANGRRTLAILFGHKWAVRFLAGNLIFANLWVVLLVILHVASPWVLLALGSLLPSVLAIQRFGRERSLTEMMEGMRRVAQTNTIFGILFLIGLLVSA